MFTHNDIWTALDRLAEAKGLSASGLARQAGLDPTAFNRSKRISPNGKPRWPSTESIAKVLDVTESTMMELFTLIDLNEGAPPAVPLVPFAYVRSGKLTAPKNHDVVRVAFKVSDQAFAVSIDDNRLTPLFRNGAILVADPGVKCKPDDRVLFYVRKDGLKGGVLKSTQKRTYSVLLPGSDFHEESFSEDKVEWIARILWSSH
jgi:phage repressor protein C with HTH and peptisase S24 domain